MSKSDRVCGLAWLVLGIGLCIGALRLSLGSFNNPGPGFTPFFSGSFLSLFGMVLLCSRSSKEVQDGRETGNLEGASATENRNKLLWTLFTLLAYIVLFEKLGFLLSTFLFFVSLFKLSNPKKWVTPLILSATSVAMTFVIFSVWLKCQLPAGILAF